MTEPGSLVMESGQEAPRGGRGQARNRLAGGRVSTGPEKMQGPQLKAWIRSMWGSRKP